MSRRLGALIGVAVVAAFIFISIIVANPAYACDGLELKLNGECLPHATGRTSGSEVVISGSKGLSNPGDSERQQGRKSNGEAAPKAPEPWDEAGARERGNYREPFTVVSAPTPPTTVTLSDIASFAPTVGGNHMEPNGWIVVGLHTNFYSDVSTSVVPGTLLGLPAAVRFTPLAWHWNYGDGTVRHSSNRGASWAALNVAEFEPTATSHVFANAGTFDIDLSIEYTAEYQFAGAIWYPIAGTLNVPTNRIVATAGDATTVLVNRNCHENPSGAGC